MATIAEILKSIGQALVGRMDQDVVDDALEYIDFNELRLAVETLCDQIYEYDVQITTSELEQLREIARETGADMQRVEPLRELVSPDA